MLTDILSTIEQSDQRDNLDMLAHIKNLNDDHTSCNSLPLNTIREILDFSEYEYYNQTEELPDRVLLDSVYDYVKELYETRAAVELGVRPDETKMTHVPDVSGDTRMCKLPIWLGSCKKMNMGQGQVKVFTNKYPDPYNISAKMDGCSCLYLIDPVTHEPMLYSRGKGDEGQNISELLKYILLPTIPDNIMVRGELIMRQSVFKSKYQRQTPDDTEKFSNSRNAIAGTVNRIGSNASKGVDTQMNEFRSRFVRDIEFIAYEWITHTPLPFDEQFTILDRVFGDQVAKHQMVDSVDDDSLSNLYDQYIEDMDYEIDGLVVASNKPHQRPYGENPDYLRAFKKPLAILTARTTVTEITWDVSREGYLRPVVHFGPVVLNDVTITKASGHNAKMIQDDGLGAGAVIDITRSGGVIPKIINVIEKVSPGFPDCEFGWNETKVHIYPLTRDTRPIDIKQLHHFLSKMGTKGIGLKLMQRLYDGGIDNIVKLLTVTESDLEFIGGKTATNIVNTIQQNKSNLTLPVLAGSCGIFGSLMGVSRFKMIFDAYPDILSSPEVVNGDVADIAEKIKTVPGFAQKTATQAAVGFPEFIKFLHELSTVGITPADTSPKTSPTPPVTDTSNTGMNILMTGFRDNDIATFILEHGGKNLKSLTKTANMLIIKDSGTRNKKTEQAEARGIQILTKQQFIDKYMS